MRITLAIGKGTKRKVYVLQGRTAVLGRASGCSLRIPSAEVSRQHCKLWLSKSKVCVEDLGSVNGTLLNGRLVEGREELVPGDRLAVGPVTFVVDFQTAEDEVAEPEITEAEITEAEITAEITEAEIIEEPLDPVEAIDEVLEEEFEDAQEPTRSHASESISEDFDLEPWQVPQQENLRELLAQMQDESPKKPNKLDKKDKEGNKRKKT